MTEVCRSILLGVCLASLLAEPVLAWGSTGHRLIGSLAVRHLDPNLPAFLHRASAAADVGELSREPDRWRMAGAVHDQMRDLNHFAYADDEGRLGGGPTFADLPATRTAYAEAIRKAGGDPDKAGYLPYAIIDHWQQLTKDFVYWRADQLGLKSDHNPAHRAWLKADQTRREAHILQDMGLLSHYVGDATQPMHLSVHHDGWGDYPNPNGFSQERLHVPYEGTYVAGVATAADVADKMTRPRNFNAPIGQLVSGYLSELSPQYKTWFSLEKAGAFKPDNAIGADYTVGRLAVAASMLRDLINCAWSASAEGQVNYPVVALKDMASGKVDIYAALHPAD